MLGPESYKALAKLCPRLESLNLQLCGQLNADAVLAWKQLPLKRLELFGPFLVRKEGWIGLFDSANLEALRVTQSPRIDLETVEKLVDSCPTLTELGLSQMGKLDDSFLIPLAKLKLRYLDLSSPSQSLSDGAVSALLEGLAPTLEHLDLSDNHDLSDDVLPAIARCQRLRHLALRNVELSEEGVVSFFESLQARGLESIDFEKGHDLQGEALRALIAHSGSTITRLSILGWRDVDKESLAALATCPLLEELNMGWCRQVTDFVLKDILDGCPKIKTIRVWGESSMRNWADYRLQPAHRRRPKEERREDHRHRDSFDLASTIAPA